MQKNKMSKFGKPLLNYTKNPCLALENHKINVIMKKQVYEIGVLEIADKRYVPLLY